MKILSFTILAIFAFTGCQAHRLSKQPPSVSTAIVGSNLRDIGKGVIEAKGSFDRIDHKAQVILDNWK